MERKFSFVEYEFYHIYNRGVDKRIIFSTTEDYERFQALLYLSNSQEKLQISVELRNKKISEIFDIEIRKPLVAIGAYSLMPNHFHLLLTPIFENGVSLFMHRLQTSYSMYFNNKNQRKGSLFQGEFKAEHLSKDEYLKYIYSYIHLNPAVLKDADWKIKGPKNLKELKLFISTFPFSSYQEYLSGDFVIVDPDPFPKYFQTSKKFDQMIDFWLSFKL